MTSKEITTHLTWLGKRLADILTTVHTHPLAPSWEFVAATDDSGYVYLLQRKTGARIYLHLFCSKGYTIHDRIQITGWFNIGKNRSFVEVRDNNVRIYPEISVSIAKNPEAIAKDIAKRFLPEYLSAFERALAIVAAENAYAHSVAVNLLALSAVAGFILPRHEETRSEVQRENSGSVNGYYVKITANARHDEQELNIDRLTVEQAAYILKYLKAQPKRSA